MRKPPFNKPAFGNVFGNVFGKVFGLEPVAEFSPLDIPNLEAWYDATDPVSINEIGGLVSSWFDKSGNVNTVEAIASERPSTNSQTINGLNTIAFDGMANLLDRPSFTTTPDFTIVFVFNPISSTNGNDSIVSFNDNGTGNDDFQIEAGFSTIFLSEFDSTGLNVGVGAVAFPGSLIGIPSALMYRLSTNDDSVRLFDSSGERSSNVGNYNGALGTDQQFMIGTNRGGVRFLEVNVGEIVIINRAITDQERTQLFNYFARWGV